MRNREDIEKSEEERLAPWASRSRLSLGRLYPEPEHEYRTAYQRDRDRVLHATAFRRLQYKTQVFIYHEGDHFRNRLTHTLEVAQVARTVARVLGLNEDLTEAIVLAHDLGHPPFGHLGQTEMHTLLGEFGGFEHNRQSLRIVDLLERPSTQYVGLNLTMETRSGILKHGSAFPRYPHPVPFPEMGTSPSAEAQLANLADEIAYNSHDVDDGLRSGLIEHEALMEVPIWREVCTKVQRDWGTTATDGNAFRRRAVGLLINELSSDLIRNADERLSSAGIASAQQVRESKDHVIAFSSDMQQAKAELAAFLRANLYLHPQVLQIATEAGRVLSDLWNLYRDQPELLSAAAREGLAGEPNERALADYLAGMTDRFAMDEHRRLIGTPPADS